MTVRIDGKINLLSGHYQDIIISENQFGNFQIKVTPNQLYSVNKLDTAYSHIDYTHDKDLDKVRKIIDYYLNNNTIFMITDRGKLKNHSGYYQAVNAYNTFINGYMGISKALYLRIVNQEFQTEYEKIIDNQYQEDRIRHLKQILDCSSISIDLSLHTSSYYIKGRKAYIHLMSEYNKDNHSLTPIQKECQFLEQLLLEFSKYNSYLISSNKNETLTLHTDNYAKEIILDDALMPHILNVKNHLYKMNFNFSNMTIQEYTSLLSNQILEEKEKKLLKK